MKRICLQKITGVLAVMLVFGLLSGCKLEEKADPTQINDSAYTVDVPSGSTVVASSEQNSFDTATFSVSTGSVQEFYIMANHPNATIKGFDSQTNVIAALSSQKVDFALLPLPIAKKAVKQNPNLTVFKEDFQLLDVGMAVSKKNPALLENLNRELEKFKEDGTLEEISKHWLTEGESYPQVDIPVSDGKNGTLRVGTSADNEPYNFVQNGKYSGLDCEVIERIAYELDMKVEYHNISFGGLIAALDANKIDVIAASMAITEERMQAVNFTLPYFSEKSALLAFQSNAPTTTSKDRPKVETITQKDPATATYGVTSNVTQDYIAKRYPDAKIGRFPSAADALIALQGGKVDYLMTSRATAHHMMNIDKTLTISQDNVIDESCHIAVAKGQDTLQAEIDALLTAWKADGTLDAMTQRWVTGGPDHYEIVDVPKATGKNGVLKVALSPDVPPICFIQDGEYAGINVELIQRLAYELDRTVEFSSMDFDALLPALQSGKMDLAISDINATAERRVVANFTQSYFDNPQVILQWETPSAASGDSAIVPTITSFLERLRESFMRTFMVENRWKLVLDGLGVTVLLSVFSGLFGSILGFGICMLRRSKHRACSIPTAVFIRLVQGTPIVVILMILYYIIFGGIDISAILVAVFGFSVNFGVYVSEMMRTGIDAVDRGQIEAAHAIGFTRIQTFWKITFPQAARHFLPVFEGEFISLVKMTSVVGYIAIQDLTKVSDIIRSRTLEAFFPLIATAIIYFVVANVLISLTSHLKRCLDPKRRKRTVKGIVAE